MKILSCLFIIGAVIGIILSLVFNAPFITYITFISWIIIGIIVGLSEYAMRVSKNNSNDVYY